MLEGELTEPVTAPARLRVLSERRNTIPIVSDRSVSTGAWPSGGRRNLANHVPRADITADTKAVGASHGADGAVGH